jgi:hypothetical protein
MNTIAVYHQCFNNKRATEFALKNFKKYNTDSTYYLISDGGLDFSDVAEKYDCNYYNDNLNVGMNNLNSSQAMVILKRLKYCFDSSNAKYILLMEDDILCRGKIEINENFDLAGADTKNNLIGEKALDYIRKKYNVNPNVNWYNACGGSILNKNIFEENYEKLQKFILEDHDYIREKLSGDLFENCPNYSWTYGWMDQMINFLYMICDKKISINPEHIECLRDPMWQSKPHKLVHQYKFNY